MQFGIQLPWAGPMATPDNVVRVAQAAEALGYWFLTAGEHLLYPRDMLGRYPYSKTGALPIDPKEANLEIFACFTFAAAHTSRIRLRTGLVVLPYRPPFVTAKQAATLDYLSKGRLILGVGVGWMIDEFQIFKVPFQERGAITDEYIQIIRALCNDQPFRGKYYQFDQVYFQPKPVQRPLPIWIGGSTTGAIRRAARFGDGWFPIGVEPADVVRLRETLRRFLQEAGRKEEDVHISGGLAVDFEGASAEAARRNIRVVPNRRDQVFEAINEWAQAGARSITLSFGDFSRLPPDQTVERMRWFAAEVMPQARSL